MTPANILTYCIEPAFGFMATILGPKPDTSQPVKLITLTIAGQEGDWSDRIQLPNGPAHSLWQFEEDGAVAGLMRHSLAGPLLRKICSALSIPFDKATIYQAMIYSDILAVIMARLLLYTSPGAIPGIDDVNGSYLYYEHLWRPGAPGPERWPDNHAMALAAMGITTGK